MAKKKACQYGAKCPYIHGELKLTLFICAVCFVALYPAQSARPLGCYADFTKKIYAFQFKSLAFAQSISTRWSTITTARPRPVPTTWRR